MSNETQARAEAQTGAGAGLYNYGPQKFTTINQTLGDGILYAPGTSNEGKSPNLEHCMIYYGYGNKRGGVNTPNHIISMVFPLPEDISDEIGLEWNADEAKEAKRASRVDRAFGTGGGWGLSMLGRAIKDVVSERTGGLIGDTRREKGVALNSHEEYYFKGVNFRNFSFKHKMIPISADESTITKNIVDTFRYLSSPGYEDGNKFFTYPSEWEIHFLHNVKGKYQTNAHLSRIGRCVLDSVKVNYTAEGSFQSLPGGEPIVTELDLSFKELDLVTKETLRSAGQHGGLGAEGHTSNTNLR